MLRCAACGSVRSRRLAGRSDPFLAALLNAPPIDVCGADVTCGLAIRASLLAGALLRLEVGRFHSGCGPVESRSPIEKERLGAEASSNWAACTGSGEEAALGAILTLVIATSSSSTLRPSSTSTWAGFISSLADTSSGVYFRSGYTRLMGLGIPVELRLRPDGISSAATLGVK